MGFSMFTYFIQTNRGYFECFLMFVLFIESDIFMADAPETVNATRTNITFEGTLFCSLV